jgi:hypothetical protein
MNDIAWYGSPRGPPSATLVKLEDKNTGRGMYFFNVAELQPSTSSSLSGHPGIGNECHRDPVLLPFIQATPMNDDIEHGGENDDRPRKSDQSLS